jgi:hypothetical protein
MEEWRYSSTYSSLRYWMEVSGHLHASAALPLGKELVDSRPELGNKISLPLPGIEHPFPGSLALKTRHCTD